MQMARNWKSGKIFSLLTVAAMLVLLFLRPAAARSIPAPEANQETSDCNLCIEAMLKLRNVTESNKTWQDVLPMLESLCEKYFGAKDMNGTYMCPGFLNQYGPVLAYVVAHKYVQPSDVCKSLDVCIQSDGVGQPAVANTQHDSDLNFLAIIHEVTKSISEGVLQQHLNQQWRSHREGCVNCAKKTLKGEDPGSRLPLQGKFQDMEQLKILQLTDIHLDIFYQEGAPVQCGLYCCCRPWHPGTGNAGRYGEYNCDLPLATLDLMLDKVKDMDIDFVLYTGDNPPHTLWNETYESQLFATKTVVNKVSEKLGAKVIYPALGNHETIPESEYLAQLPLYQNMTKAIASYWAEWFPMSEEAAYTISRGGYYTTTVCDGLRIVAINSDYGYWKNLYALINQQNSYFYEHSNWVHSILSMAESKNEKVLLLAHVPPGPVDATPWYIDFLFNITKRYHKTITGFITGHSHKDQFRLMQDKHGVYSAVMVAPSMTPQGLTNPSFRVYSMDRSTFNLLDYQQYHLNLTRANELALQGVKPSFELTYTASEEYGMDDLSPASWSALAGRFVIYNSLLQHYVYNTDGRKGNYGQCDSECQKEAICAINHPGLDEYTQCIANQ